MTAVMSKYLCRCQSSVCLSKHICVQMHFVKAHGGNDDNGYYDDDDAANDDHYDDDDDDITY